MLYQLNSKPSGMVAGKVDSQIVIYPWMMIVVSNEYVKDHIYVNYEAGCKDVNDHRSCKHPVGVVSSAM